MVASQEQEQSYLESSEDPLKKERILASGILDIDRQLNEIYLAEHKRGVPRNNTSYMKNIYPLMKVKGELVGRYLLHSSIHPDRNLIKATTEIYPGEKLWSGSQNRALLSIRDGDFSRNTRCPLHYIRVPGEISSSTQAQSLIGNTIYYYNRESYAERTLHELSSPVTPNSPQDAYVVLLRFLMLKKNSGLLFPETRLEVLYDISRKKNDQVQVTFLKTSVYAEVKVPIPKDVSIWNEIQELHGGFNKVGYRTK